MKGSGCMKRMSKVTAAVAVLFVLSLLSIDCESWMPFIVCAVSWIYLACVAWRDGWFYDPEDDAE